MERREKMGMTRQETRDRIEAKKEKAKKLKEEKKGKK